jgi:hypothetical protein
MTESGCSPTSKKSPRARAAFRIYTHEWNLTFSIGESSIGESSPMASARDKVTRGRALRAFKSTGQMKKGCALKEARAKLAINSFSQC